MDKNVFIGLLLITLAILCMKGCDQGYIDDQQDDYPAQQAWE